VAVGSEDAEDVGEVRVGGGLPGVREGFGPGSGVAFGAPAVEVEVDGGLVGFLSEGGDGAVGDVGGGAGIGVIGGSFGEVGLDGVAFDVDHRLVVVA